MYNIKTYVLNVLSNVSPSIMLPVRRTVAGRCVPSHRSTGYNHPCCNCYIPTLSAQAEVSTIHFVQYLPY
jgi:hypothetical protein